MAGEDIQKVQEYFNVIENNIIKFIKNACIDQSCITTILLVFAVADSLGKLTHPNSNATSGERFKFLISKFGKKYEDKKNKLWKLRNSLAHNALNVEVFLSMTELGEEHHLEDVNAPGQIYINTKVLFDDFCSLFNSEKLRIIGNNSALTQAGSRLVWHYDEYKYSLDFPVTPPPPVSFIGTT